MSAPVAMTVTLDRAAGTARLVQGDWSNTVPVADLPRWLDLYEFGRTRRPGGRPVPGEPGPYAPFYDQPCAALRKALEEVSEWTT